MTDRSVVIRLRGDITDFVSKMRAAGASAKDSLGKELDKVEGKRKQALNDLGNTAGKVGLVAAAGLGFAVNAAANFDQAMSHVAATGDDARGSIDALRAAALKAGADTAFSATEAAAGIEALAKAGVSAEDALAGGLTGALDLAAAGTIDVQSAAEAAATAMTQFGLTGADVPHIADLLAAAAGKAQGEVSDMNYALAQSGLVADQVGLSIEETTGGLAAFASAGLLGSDAGTSFKTMLGALTPNSAKAAKAMSDLGINAYDAQGNFIGLADFAGNLHEALADMTDQQRQSTLETIFGSDAVRAASVLYEQGEDGIRKWISAVDDQGFAAETAATKMDNLKGDLEQLRGSLETALIGTGEGAQGPLRGLVQGATEAVNAFNALPPAAKNVAGGLLAITAITGGAAFFGVKVVSGIAATRTALQTLGLTADQSKASLLGVAKAGGVLSAALISISLQDMVRQSQALDLPGLTRDLAILGKTGQTSGELLDEFGSSLTDAKSRKLLPDGASFAEDLAIQADALDSVGDKIEAFGGDKKPAQFVLDIDSALADLAATSAPDAEAAFNKLAEAAATEGVSTEQLMRLFPEYAKELERASLETEGATGATSEYAQAQADSAAEAKREAAALRESIEAMQKKRAEALRALDAELGYAQALLDAKKATKENKRTLDTTTQAGIDNMRVIEDLAGAWNAQDAATKNARGAYKQARADLVATAHDLGATWPEARRLARELLEIPTRVKTDVDADVNPAIAELQRVKTFLDNLKGKSIEVQVTRRLVEQTGLPKATGGYISGPGTATSDSIPAMLSNGEYVIKASAVSHYGADFFHRANSMRLAGGGYVARSWSQRRTGSSAAAQVMQVSGTLDTPWGPAHVEGIARDVARQEIDADASYQAGLERMDH